MKNLIVNAQVTAMVSFFEVAGILVVILVNVIAPQYNCASVVLFQLLENIILPYFFILNTRKNKDKIVEQGWKNVFQNSSILHNLSLPYTQSIDVISINDKLETHKNDIYIKPESFNMKIMKCNLNIPDVHEKPSTSIIPIPIRVLLNSYLMRREMLEKLKDRKHEERIYQNILQEFIDMEEHILEDEKT